MAHAAETSTHRITLDFEDAATLALALEHIGDRDAPVMLTGGTVTTGGETHPLWEGYHASLSRAEGEVAAELHGAPAPMTTSDLIRTVREIAAADPERTCEGPCEYRDENNDPVCLIGHALARFGRHDQMDGNAENIAAVRVYDWKEKVKSTLTQRDWLHHVQKKQDEGTPWAEAVRATDHQMGADRVSMHEMLATTKHMLQQHDETDESLTALLEEAAKDRPHLSFVEVVELMHMGQHDSPDWNPGHTH